LSYFLSILKRPNSQAGLSENLDLPCVFSAPPRASSLSNFNSDDDGVNTESFSRQTQSSGFHLGIEETAALATVSHDAKGAQLKGRVGLRSGKAS